MKKTLISLVLVLGLLIVPLVAQVTFGIGPGVQYAGGRQHPLNLSYNPQYRCTGFGEIWVNIPVWWKLSLRPGLTYLTKEFNATVAYSGLLHSTTPATVKMGVVEMPVLLIVQPVGFFHIGAGGYISEAISHELNFDELMQTPALNLDGSPCTSINHGKHLGWYKNGHHYGTTKHGCPPPPPCPKPILLGDPVNNFNNFDWGYILITGLDWYIKCPTWSFKNSLNFSFSRGVERVFQTFGRSYVNETFSASYIFWF